LLFKKAGVFANNVGAAYAQIRRFSNGKKYTAQKGGIYGFLNFHSINE